MTDRLKGFVVSLQNDIREDDAEAIISSIKMIKGVSDVSPVPSDISDHINRERIKRELRMKLFRVLEENEK